MSKNNLEREKGPINATWLPFQKKEAYFSETQYFDELEEEGEVAIT